nr:threonine/serine exporter family protein [Nanchangia anserum]
MRRGVFGRLSTDTARTLRKVPQPVEKVRRSVREHNLLSESATSEVLEIDRLRPESHDHLNPHGAEHEELRQVRDRLAAQSQVTMRLGHMLLESGASSYRVKLSMARLGRAVGVEQQHSQVTFGEISSTVYAHGTFRTEVSEQRVFGTNAAKLDRLRHFVQHLKPHVTVEDVNSVLDRIQAFRPEYGTTANMLASGIACMCFCFLNRGGFIECLLAGIAATVGQALRKQMLVRHMNHFGVWMMCGLVAATCYIGLATGFQAVLDATPAIDQAGLPQWFTGTAQGYHAGIISAVLFLVPGFPLLTGMLDLVRTDISAGISRLTYVLMLVISAGTAVWLVSLSFNWVVDPPESAPIDNPWLFLVRMVCSFVAAFGFAMLFNSEVKLCFWAALICAIVNPIRFFVVEEGMLWQFAVGVEALLIGLAADAISRISGFRYSRVSLSVPASVIMIPGVPLYAALTHMNQGAYTQAISSLVEVLLVVLAIGIGLAIARMLTDPGWRTEAGLRRAVNLEQVDAPAEFFMR